MTTTILANHERERPAKRRFSTRHIARAIWSGLKRRHQQWQDFEHLSSLDDRQLTDIGIHRVDIYRAVYGPQSGSS